MPTLPTGLVSATYRLQFNKDFTFQDAAKIIDYLSQLGISHVYASPILSARRGSTHGYDAIDPTRLNPELGTEADFAALQDKLREYGLGLILDIVPNHMSASSENSWWMDVLENGPESAYASYFDIDWHPPSRMLEGKVLLPVLGRPFGEALEHQDLKLVLTEGKFFVQYFESLFPLAPSTYHLILKRRLNELRTFLGQDSPVYQEYSGIVAAAAAISDATIQGRDAAGEKRLQFEALRQRLRQLVGNGTKINEFIQQNLKGLEGNRKEPSSFTSLESLLAQQHYVLAYWQNVNEEINYRRFFTINDLVGLRMQDPLVFDATHALVLRMVEQKSLNGLRIDHIDGLRDPLGYLLQLSERVGSDTRSVTSLSIPIFVEKILARDEQLTISWPVAGTTGYEFANALNCLFVDPAGAKAIEQVYSRFLGRELIYENVLYQKKRLVMATLLGVEVRALEHQLQVLARDDRYAREIPRSELDQALIETTAHLSVYRTYIRNLEVSAQDEQRIEQALRNAQARTPQLPSRSFDFLCDVLLLRNRPHLLPGQREARLAFTMRWQQFTGPIMAKAFEDTFLYVYNPLISLNEVGGDPRPSTAISMDFSKFVINRLRDFPNALNATTTHDTKRGEDVRARISVLSEIPEEWRQHLDRWSKLNARHRKSIDGQAVPDRNEEIFLYQTLLGAWPLEQRDFSSLSERMQAYLVKATREAMVHTRWTQPNMRHERALQGFVSSIIKSGSKNDFLHDFGGFQECIGYYGMINGLSQTLLKIASAGIPDFYQGSELWDLRLVDPDNRQRVDFDKRAALLASLPLADLPQPDESTLISLSDLTHNWKDGRIKLYLICKALHFRAQNAMLFSEGEFLPLECRGKHHEHVLAFARPHKKDWVLIVVPRWLARARYPVNLDGSDGFWGNTTVGIQEAAPVSWRNILTGETFETHGPARKQSLHVGSLLRNFPVALLSGTTSSKRARKAQ
jgi:(1->4)-alpha-D-glucan 1-alpha-D-glucosylmutase